jgi:hypothetical protein
VDGFDSGGNAWTGDGGEAHTPLLLVPIALAHVWRLREPSRGTDLRRAFLAVLAAVVLPFAVLSPGGVWDSFWPSGAAAADREPRGGLLLVSHHLFGLG